MPRQKDRKKLLPQRDRSFICGGKWGASDGSLYFAGTQAAGAGVYTLRCTVNKCLYSSDIRFPSSVGTSVGMGDLNAKGYALAANIALCHFSCTSFFVSCIADIILPQHRRKCKIFFEIFSIRRLVILNAKEQIPRRMTGTRSIAFIFLPSTELKHNRNGVKWCGSTDI